MEKTRVLFISQEITPYLPETELSMTGRQLPQGIQEKGKEIRTFMPRFGCINERRNQLHEVIRLSGMNLIIDDTDHPLIIKVASIQAARMQVYFIDNEDYFHRKAVMADSEGKFFEDNDERAIFFARGVFETVKKLRWSPDLIVCQGWLTSLVPLYLKKAYNDDPLFADTKLIFTASNDSFDGELNKEFSEKLMFEKIEKSDVEGIQVPNYMNVSKLAMDYSDAIIIGSNDVNPELLEYAHKDGKKILPYQDREGEYVAAYDEFFDTVLGE
jgi:starch synthase